VHGLYARAGFNANSAGVTSVAYELPNSGTSLVSTLEQDSNVNAAGKWMFEISSTTVNMPVSTPNPEPIPVPVGAPISAPIKAPVAAPVATPVSPPVKSPTSTPVPVPVSPPVRAPVAAPVTTPVSTPVAVTTSRRSVGSAITTSSPFYSVLMDHPLTPPANLLGPIPKPYPTNSWHTNMWLNQGNMPIITSPYIVEVRNTGVQVSYSARTFTASSGITVFTENFAMLVKETISQRRVLDWDLLSVTLIWSNNQPTTYNADTINYGTRASSMIAPLVQGSPYITTKWDGLTPVITTVHAILSVNGATGTTFSGTKFKIALNNGQTWILYASNSITFNWSGSTLTATGTYNGILRGVCMTDSSFENVLDQYKDSVPIASKVGWTASGDDAVLQFDYITEDDSAPLMMTLPHHRDMMSGVTYVMSNAYTTMKGKMSGLVGKSWKMTEQLTTITWGAPRSIPSQYIESIRTALRAEQSMTQTASDTYSSGKNLAAMARLALIADEIGETSIASSIRSRLKTLLQNWFNGQTSDKIIYDHTWGGVTSSNGIKDSGADYGVGYYNDVHFHFGYFVYAAAVVAKGDSAWATTHTPAINDLVRAYANPVHDSYFPVTRMKDWYAGHSWASGLFEFGDVKNQESSSESINGYYGMYLWGLVSNNTNLRDLGRLMLAQEIRSTKKYWHMDNKSNEVYDQVFANNGCVGIVWGMKIDFATWFGSNIEYIVGIQMMPFTPITEEYMTSTWVNTVYPSISTALTRASPTLEVGWRGFIYMAQAVLDRSTAWTNINTLSGWDNGNSKTNALYWIATRA
jgi:endo-1,3(4)-beta-glucanase